ncbi:TrkA family potassium uptake protein [Methylotenera sp.]|uniref:potassium channel family protein n=1 Tax=Methylotenera sp. TaxID=2051956 RepID=UPI002719516B|nr:potassium channel protein [Methylotenera sp.]MDO9204437.1 NAD-binding protein [Methylotenera sp.]MDO9394208.1 NAD-binding protein [Methylotenera sp.]MDP1521958.1 NAD-binding protein [Methylotenera sp.]MDP2072178.1 NAD-binding protein [Methylotenera sp.]MDP2231648.1 NAD-binding protein [Methylotenera sp.]
MDSILFLILRRLRRPLIFIIVSFGIAIIGLTLMPGTDDKGHPWHMSVFQALYVISYTATTIGFGEVPYPFSQAQRMWMTFSIYLTVIPWFYAIGKIITLLQDPSLRLAMSTERFARSVRQLQEPFYILCSYGESASVLAKALDEKGMRVVVIEPQQERLTELELSDTRSVIPYICADAKLPENLIRAGVHHPLCSGVVTLTDNDEVNLAVAVAVKLMNPDLPVLARAERDDIAANMASFGTDHIINPYTLFGDQLAIRVHAIGTYILHEWLTDIPGDTIPPPETPPRGQWVVCGYGRFGKSVIKNLEREHISATIVEAMPQLTGCEQYILGSGTEAKTLIEAGIESAVGIVAGTDNDINNLSIVMTAYELNPKLFVVIRKNKRHNDTLFKQFNADITMQPTDIIAHECLAHMISPMLAQFLALARNQSNSWSNQLISKLVGKVGELVPETWAVTIDQQGAPAVAAFLSKGHPVSLYNLTQDPTDREQQLDLVPLMLLRDNMPILVPDTFTTLAIGDRILFCGRPAAKATLPILLDHVKTLAYILDGVEVPDSIVWRWLKTKLQANCASHT